MEKNNLHAISRWHTCKKAGKRVMTLLLALVVMISCLIPAEVHAAAKKSITLSSSKVTLYAGEYTTITVKKITGLSSKKVTYKSSNTRVATVTSKGVVTAKKKGTATITVTSASDKKVKATFKVTVKAKPKKSNITLTRKKASVEVGKSTTIKVKGVTGLSSKKVTYKSGNKKVATVSSKGVVKAKKKGTATITVTSAVNKKVKTTFQVTVTEKQKNIPVTSIDTASSVTLEVNSGIKLATTIVPANATNKKLTFTSNNPSVAKVIDSEGGILGISAGNATITIKSADGNVTKKVKVTVKKKVVKVESIDLPINEKTDQALPLPTGEANAEDLDKYTKVLPSNATNKELYWTTSDPTVAVVKNGKIIGIGPGRCRVTAHSCDGNATSHAMLVDVEMCMTEKEAYQYLREHPKVTELSMYIPRDMFYEYMKSLREKGIVFTEHETDEEYFKRNSVYNSGSDHDMIWLTGHYEKYEGKTWWVWDGTMATGKGPLIDIWNEL